MMKGAKSKKSSKKTRSRDSSKVRFREVVSKLTKRPKRSVLVDEERVESSPESSDMEFAVEELRPQKENVAPSPGMDSDSDTGDDLVAGSQSLSATETPGTSSSIPSVREPEFVPLANLTLGSHKKTIRVAVSHVTEIVHWPKQNPRGTVFSVDVVDGSGDARVVVYNDLCNKFHDLLKLGQSVQISSFTCRLVNPRWKTTKSAFELLLTSESRVENSPRVVLPQDSLAPDFLPLSAVNTTFPEQFVNLIGVVVFLGPKKQVRRRSDGRLLSVRDAKLIDESLSPVTLTCWSDALDVCDAQDFPVVQVTRARTKKFGSTVMVSVGTGSQLEFNADSSRGRILRRWWQTQDHDLLVQRFSAPSPVVEALLSFEEAEKKFTTLPVGSSLTFWNHGEVVFLASDSLLYQGCAEDACSKKVDSTGENKWTCSKCHVTSSNFRWMMSLRMVVKDQTREIRCISFGQVAERLLKLSAQAISTLYETDSAMLQRVLTAPCGNIYRMRFVYRKNSDESATDVVVTSIEVPEDESD